MKRSEIRSLKRAVRHECSETAMLGLLERSVRFGHKRLALIRCLQAERMGVTVPAELLFYCQTVADGLAPEAIIRIVRRAQSEPGVKH